MQPKSDQISAQLIPPINQQGASEGPSGGEAVIYLTFTFFHLPISAILPDQLRTLPRVFSEREIGSVFVTLLI